MAVSVEKQNFIKSDRLLWGIIALMVLVAISGNYYFTAQPLLLRVIVQLVLVAAAIVLATKTAFGQKAYSYWQEAVVEVRKVVWPTKKETIQATLGVLAMVLVMGVLLWSIDAILLRLVGWLIGR